MLKQALRRCHGWVIWLNIITVSVYIVSMPMAFFMIQDREYFWLLFIVCSLIVFSTLLSFIAYFAQHMFSVHFGDENIQQKWGAKTLNRLHYADIKGVLIEATRRDDCFSTRYDKNKKPWACMVLYKIEEFEFRKLIFSKSNSSLMIPPDACACCELNIDGLRQLMEKSTAIVYVSEQILMSYERELSDILDVFYTRVVVAYYDTATNSEKKAPYKDFFMNRRNTGDSSMY